jgi:o-succinylbenzoate synthase
MSYHIQITKRQLHFKQPAGTSRGVYKTRDVYYLKLTSDEHPDRFGIGECAPMEKLSCDWIPNYDEILQKACRDFEQSGKIDFEALRPYPSVLFGLETALQHYQRGSFCLWDSPFSRGKQGIQINGLIWMGTYKEMLLRIDEKLSQGFRCIKVKIGAIDFEEEIKLLKLIRKDHSINDVELRVDANGGFSISQALQNIYRLAELDIHSIEQPIMTDDMERYAWICEESPIPIALDEQLIGVNDPLKKHRLLDQIRPQYIVLKPSLHGGINGCTEWIEEAHRQHIGWWITSALESNIGLNAIAQWCATLGNLMPQGLGTGALFTDNIDLPLSVKGDELWFDPHIRPQI